MESATGLKPGVNEITSKIEIWFEIGAERWEIGIKSKIRIKIKMDGDGAGMIYVLASGRALPITR